LSANRPPLIRNKLPPHLAALDLCSCSRASKIFSPLLLGAIDTMVALAQSLLPGVFSLFFSSTLVV